MDVALLAPAMVGCYLGCEVSVSRDCAALLQELVTEVATLSVHSSCRSARTAPTAG